MPLLAAADFNELPVEPIARWLQLRDLLEKRLDDEYDFASDREEIISNRILYEYYTTVRGTAPEELQNDLPTIGRENLHESIEYFRAEVAAVAAQSLFHSTKMGAVSLRLAKNVEERLLEEAEKLRQIVMSSDLDITKKEKLFSLINKLIAEIENGQLNYKNITSILGSLAIGMTMTTTFLAEAPEALATIQQLIGFQQEAQDSKQNLLEKADEPAVPQLPSPPKRLQPPEAFEGSEV
ncbi:hypothetical protein [Celeribacter sp.]|uniref:hypothetical protein n=1 Tax=Celeribacter sp. TaxID=1890673 RepID=UPI003A8E5158